MVRILGPLEVVSAGRPVRLGGARQRVLLTSLLVRRGEVVSADRLIEDVYGDDPPPTATKSLQAHISRLRTALGPDWQLVWHGGGYQLDVADDELDAAIFIRLLGEGVTALIDGRAEDAVASLDTALALWRGQALADAAYADFAQGEIARLEELRLGGLEALSEARLSLGEHAQVVPQLEQLIAAHPFRERLRWLHLLGLYRSGRQADALDAYQAARGALVDELGIEPGRALRELHQAILNQDPGLDLPSTDAQELDLEIGGPSTLVIARDAPVSDTRKTVTAVFVRLAIAAASAEALDPEALRRITARALGLVKSATERHGGSVESVSGDSITVVFSLPAVNEDDAWRAVKAATEARADLTALAGSMLAEQEIRLSFGIGASTGQVVTGQAVDLTLRTSGEPLTRSASLGLSAASGEILVDQATYRLVRYSVASEPTPGGWRVQRLSADVQMHAGRLTSTMVGRDRERRRLRDAFEQALEASSCHLFTVLGVAGVGKSRLLQEFLADLTGRALVVRGRCLPYGEGITYWPLLEAVADAVGLTDTDAPDLAVERIFETFGEHPQAGQLATALSEMVGLSESTPAAESGFRAPTVFFTSLARQKPLVLVFDDVHWAEHTFLDLVESVAVSPHDAPILLVCLARPELLDTRPDWGGGKWNATTTLLEPLSESECGDLLDNLVGSSGLDSSFKTRIAAAAEGNPLFVEEMLSMLIDDGLIVPTEDGWAPTMELREVRAPPTIQALLAARLDRLAPTERAVIERASIAGKVFFADAIFDLSPRPERPTAEDALAALVRKDLIRPQAAGSGRPTYRFRHMLIRDAAYESMPKEARAELHEQFGRWLTATVGDRATEYEEVVGYHLEQAYRYRAELGPVDDASKLIAREAAERLGGAGHRALDRSDAPAGLNLISRAIALLPADDPLRVDLVPSMRVVQGVHDLAWVERVLTEAVEAAATTGDRILAANALVQRGFLRLFTENGVTPGELIDTAERAVAVFEDLGDHLGLARAWRLVGQAHYLGGSLAGCGKASEQALRHVRLASNRFEEREIVEWLVIALLLGPTRAEAAVARCRELLDDATDNPMLQAEIAGGLAMLTSMLGRESDADTYVELARASMRAGERIWIVAFWLSFVHLGRRDLEAAEAELRPGYEVLRELGETSHFSSLAHALATTTYTLGRYDEAETLTYECEAACRPNDIHSGIMWRSIRAKIHARRGEHATAADLSRKATDLAARSDFLVARADALLDRAEVLSLAGHQAESTASVEDAIHYYMLKGNASQAANARQPPAEN
jgi:predicted ATPase/DNA-binding SARP family transcriptional activator